ncbi:MAG: DUF2306 domain-containing protein, partial [Micromonosporaceae bacterium]
MAQSPSQLTDPPAGRDGDAVTPLRSTDAPEWWRRPWIIPLVVVVVGYVIYQTSPFRGFDEQTAPMPPHPGFPAYYTLLMLHIISGTIAMLAVCLQVWPWLRINHPKVHRVSGRIYVVAAIVGGTMGLIIVRFAPAVGRFGVSMAAALWVITTAIAFVMIRRGNFVLHRRFMLYSFAIVMNNVWGVLIVNAVLRAKISVDILALLEVARWFGWVLNLMLV